MAQAKRSPILGYNHNVKYRGVIFHVQTEDSGLLNPHLFTHLFHEGVIVSTRKLVYDAGSNEDAIKALMQAQHKAVMKDLRKGVFDDKIDQYLGGTPGLEPRAGEDPAAAAAKPRGERAKTEADPAQSGNAVPMAAEPDAGTTAPTLEIVNEDLSEPIELPLKKPSKQPPAPAELDAPTTLSANADMAAAVRQANSAPVPPQPEAPQQQEPIAKPRATTAQKVSRSGAGQTPAAGSRTSAQQPVQARPAATPVARPPVIDITEDEISSRLRAPRDTAVEAAEDIDTTQPVRVIGDRAAHNAASLPPSKPQARPSMSPPVVTRPAPDAPRKRPGDSEAVEIYQPAPPSVEPPPGERSERAGTYSVSRKSGDAPIREKTGRIAALNPAALGLDGPSKPGPAPAARPGSRPGSVSDTGPSRTVGTPPRDHGSGRVGPGIPRDPTPGTPTANPASTRGASPPPPPQPPRSSGTPAPVAPRLTAPIQNRTSTPVTPQPSSGVVMTRPAVIVGQPPPKAPTAPTQQRVRKAREDEGRGFGQGLISEKSLDEVILAYLSEDAEDK